jgi:hypothetical protein
MLSAALVYFAGSDVQAGVAALAIAVGNLCRNFVRCEFIRIHRTKKAGKVVRINSHLQRLGSNA